MSGDHDAPQPPAWIVRLAAANDAIGGLVAAMAQQIASPGPNAEHALAVAKAAYQTATGSPADDAVIAAYHGDADAMARRSRDVGGDAGHPAVPTRRATAYRVERCEWLRSGV
jgi:hypothetical protein